MSLLPGELRLIEGADASILKFLVSLAPVLEELSVHLTFQLYNPFARLEITKVVSLLFAAAALVWVKTLFKYNEQLIVGAKLSVAVNLKDTVDVFNAALFIGELRATTGASVSGKGLRNTIVNVNSTFADVVVFVITLSP